MPPKTEMEVLFDTNRMILRGTHFEEALTDEKLISVTGGAEERVGMIRRD